MFYLPRGPVSVLLTLALVFFIPAYGQADIPEAIEHQGYIEVNNEPFGGNGAFRFALVDGSGNNVWTNDGTELGNSNMPASAVTVNVTDGVYSMALGDGTVTEPLPDSVLNSELSLRVWFADGSNGVQRLEPDKPLRSVPYARQAGRAVEAEEALDVPDVLTVDRVEYSTPRSRFVALGPGAFRPGSDATAFALENFGASVDGSGSLYAPINIPAGATLEYILIQFRDDDGDSDVEFAITGQDGSGPATVVEVDTTGESGTTSIEVDDINEQVDIGTAYTIEARDMSGDWHVDDMRILRVVVEYSLTEAP